MNGDVLAVLAPAIAGLIGVLLGGYASGRHQLSAQLRERMLDVATEFLDSMHAAQALLGVEPGTPAMDPQEALQRAELTRSRLLLVFGPDSVTAERADCAYDRLFAALLGYQKPLRTDARIPKSEETAATLWQADRQSDDFRAEQALTRFTQAATRAIRRSSRPLMLDRFRAGIRRLLMKPSERRLSRKLGEASRAADDAVSELRKQYEQLRKLADEAEAAGADPEEIRKAIGSDE
jgi:hypothetical protein